jgi:hypothetical protein
VCNIEQRELSRLGYLAGNTPLIWKEWKIPRSVLADYRSCPYYVKGK